MRPRPLFAVLALLLAGLVAPPAGATQMRHLDTRGLVRGSNDIVIGTVESTRSYWDPAHTHILTDVTVRVSESLKGAAATTLTLTQIGGEVDGLRYDIEGSPRFSAGEEALLFVWRDARGRAQVNALAQGKFDIRRDPATGVARVQRSLPGFGVRDVRTLALVPAGETAPGSLLLDDIRREIQRALAEAGR
jgi:hypothetical protein